MAQRPPWYRPIKRQNHLVDLVEEVLSEVRKLGHALEDDRRLARGVTQLDRSTQKLGAAASHEPGP